MSDTLPSSPCVGICRLDEPSGLCLGCGRTGAEVAAWRDLDEARRATVWSLLPERMARLGLGFRLLPVAGPALAERLLRTAHDRATVFAIGVQGAVAEFMRAPHDRAIAEGDADRLRIRSQLGALRLDLRPWVRVFAFGPEDGSADEIVLAVHRSRLPSQAACTLVELGPDRDAVHGRERSALLFDLGLDRPTIRFCVRTGDPGLILELRKRVGQPLPAVAPALIPLLLERHPHRVVVSPLGRIEVTQPIGLRNGKPGTPVGPHTHLLPHLLRTGRELAPGRDLPAGYAAVASLFPGPRTAQLWSTGSSRDD
ncbi:MAG: DUF1289 domain-containing protein [Geminicoccaceae bacterium]